MKKIIPLLVLLSACAKTSYSAELTEPATVADLIYTPATHGGGMAMPLGKGSMSYVSVDVEPRYAVVFECAHGRFIIESNQTKAEGLYKRLHRGDLVTIHYREEYVADDKGAHLKGYDFLNVTRDVVRDRSSAVER